MTAAPVSITAEEAPPLSREAFTDLLEPNLRSVRAFVRRQMRNADCAEDITQRTLMLAFVNRHQLRETSKFRGWLLSIAANEIRMFFRASRPLLPLADTAPAYLCDRSPSPLARYELAEEVQRLRNAIAKLSYRDRTAIRLLELDEFSFDEAAAQMSLSKSAVKSIAFRARRRLATAMEPLERPASYRAAAIEQQ